MAKQYRQAPSNRTTEKVLGKSLPFSVEAERAVLGSLLLHDGHADMIVDQLEPIDFYSPAHRMIFEAICQLVKRNNRIDLVSLQDELTKMDKLSAIGGVVYLVSLQEDIPAASLLSQHAQIIREKAVLRQLISSATDIISNCYRQDDEEISAVLDHAERTIFEISHKRVSQSFQQLSIWMKRTFQHLSDIKSHNKSITGISSGFEKLDEFTSGLQNNDFIVLAARPSMGKTAMALNIARHAAHQGITVGVFSLEMAAEQLTLRLLAAESGISLHKIRNALISSDEFIILTQRAAALQHLKLYIDDIPMQSMADIRSKARKLKAEQNLSLLVIDYLQLLRSTSRWENRQQEVSEISRSLKALAKELSIPIVALSQLSRAVDSRVDKRPILSDLRESGAIEQDADLIMFLYRDVVYNPETEDPSYAELIIGKQRNGPIGMVPLTYQNHLTRFVDHAECVVED